EFHELDTREKRQERLPVLPFAQQRKRPAALAVKTPERGDEIGFSGVEARELDRALDRVGAVVDEEGILEIPGSDLSQELRERPAQGIEQLLTRERHPRELVGDRFHDLGMPDAGAVDSVSAETVDEAPPQDVLEDRTLTLPLERRTVPHLDDRFAVV